MKAVLRPEAAVKGDSWPSRLLDGLGGLGGWLVAPDPGLNRLRTVLGAMLTIAGAIGAEWLFVHFTGASASLTSLQSAVAGPGGCIYTRSASLFDLIEQRLAAPGSGSGDGHLALRDLRLIDGALAELAGALGLHVTSYDIGPADDQIRSAGAPDPAGEPASSQSAAADGGEPDR